MSVISDRRDTPLEDRTLYWHLNRVLERYLPERLYPRSLLIVIAPVVLLQGLMAWVFLDRHYEAVTVSLSRSFVRDIALVMKTWEQSAHTQQDMNAVLQMANDDLALGLSISKGDVLPPPTKKPFLSSLHPKLNRYIEKDVGLPFWLDTVGQTGYVDVRIKTPDDLTFRFLTDLDRAHASTTPIFIAWMVGGSLFLLIVAIIFLRNQIKPIESLSRAMQQFGMGRDIGSFRSDGAAEVQQAARAFIKMKARIERHVEQRTAMLAGVSHDMRTILTRFKLELALLPKSPEVEALSDDVNEMERMLEGYLAFVRGDGGESTMETDIFELVAEIRDDVQRGGPTLKIDVPRDLKIPLKPQAFKRCISNLAQNAVNHAEAAQITAWHDGAYLHVVVEDDGPGIDEAHYVDVFKPFVRLDAARNQDAGGTGLGMAVAKDIAQIHGGDIVLGKSELGGLKAEVRIPT